MEFSGCSVHHLSSRFQYSIIRSTCCHLLSNKSFCGKSIWCPFLFDTIATGIGGALPLILVSSPQILRCQEFVLTVFDGRSKAGGDGSTPFPDFDSDIITPCFPNCLIRSTLLMFANCPKALSPNLPRRRRSSASIAEPKRSDPPRTPAFPLMTQHTAHQGLRFALRHNWRNGTMQCRFGFQGKSLSTQNVDA